jgi:hypothetical protein
LPELVSGVKSVAELSLCWFAMSACEEDGADAGSAGREIGNPVVADFVAKVENRTTPKISRK